jgi:hypothetical protein
MNVNHQWQNWSGFYSLHAGAVPLDTCRNHDQKEANYCYFFKFLHFPLIIPYRSVWTDELVVLKCIWAVEMLVRCKGEILAFDHSSPLSSIYCNTVFNVFSSKCFYTHSFGQTTVQNLNRLHGMTDCPGSIHVANALLLWFKHCKDGLFWMLKLSMHFCPTCIQR